MRQTSLLIAAAALLVCASCSTTTTVRGDGFVLTSPFSAESTETWRAVVAEEVANVTSFFRIGIPDPPVDVRLDPIAIEEGANILQQTEPNVGGVHAWQAGGTQVHLFANSQTDGQFATSVHENLRHELSHLVVHRMRLATQPWFNEGLAHEVEETIDTPDGLVFHPSPAAFVLARALARDVDLAAMWAWDGQRTPVPEDEATFRFVGRSFVRFLIEREAPGEWRSHLAQMAAIRPAEDPSLVAEWRGWLDRFDIAGRIDAGSRSADESVRAAAAASLTDLAEAAQRLGGMYPSIAEVVDDWTDSLALRLVALPECRMSAGCYLVYFRARALPGQSVTLLTDAASPPPVRLVGYAVEARRGTPVDEAVVRSLWQGLDTDERRRRLIWLPANLPLER